MPLYIMDTRQRTKAQCVHGCSSAERLYTGGPWYGISDAHLCAHKIAVCSGSYKATFYDLRTTAHPYAVVYPCRTGNPKSNTSFTHI